MTSETRVRLILIGRVQGVGLRHAACDAASECGVTGWVRNLLDGSVEIVAQGTLRAVARMTTWAGRGPSGASVERVLVERQDPGADVTSFGVRR